MMRPEDIEHNTKQLLEDITKQQRELKKDEKIAIQLDWDTDVEAVTYKKSDSHLDQEHVIETVDKSDSIGDIYDKIRSAQHTAMTGELR